MRQIDANFLTVISGGNDYISFETWEKVNQKAIRDGVVFSAIGTSLLCSMVYAATQSVSYSATSAAILAPYLAGYGYFKSKAWAIFN